MTFLSSKTGQSPPGPCMQLPNTTTRLNTLETTVVTKVFEQWNMQHVKSTLNSVQPTMLPICQVLAHDSSFNNFKVYGLLACREITFPLGTWDRNCGKNHRWLDILNSIYGRHRHLIPNILHSHIDFWEINGCCSTEYQYFEQMLVYRKMLTPPLVV